MATLWEKALHIQILLHVVSNDAHKRYYKNVFEDEATPKPGEAGCDARAT
jgi:hypothetical protein